MMDDEFCQVNSDKTMTHLVAPSIYGSWTIGNATGMKTLSKSPGGGEGYIKTLSMEHLENFCTQIGATESTYSTGYFGIRQTLLPVFACVFAVAALTMVVSAVFRRSTCTVLSRFPLCSSVRPSAKQHPSGHWIQCITRRPKVFRGVLA